MSNDTIKATLPQDLYSKKQKNHKLMRRSSVSQVILDTQKMSFPHGYGIFFNITNYRYCTIIKMMPMIVKTMPVARFNVSGFALLAKRAAIKAHNRVKKTHKDKVTRSG